MMRPQNRKEKEMRERLLICDTCGTEEFYTPTELLKFIEGGAECLCCGYIDFIDHGWCEVDKRSEPVTDTFIGGTFEE